MLRRSVRFGIKLGILVALGVAVAKLLGDRRSSDPEPALLPIREWPPLQPDPDQAEPAAPATWLQPDPDAPAVHAASPAATASGAWVEPTGPVCPTSHPVKAKLKSKIFHLPGMLNYDRTQPDRCYVDGPAAEADGLRPAKR